MAVIGSWFGAFALIVLSVAPRAASQDPQLQQRVAEIKQYLSLNKQVLAQYTWQESQIVSVKGEVKKEELFQVQMGFISDADKQNGLYWPVSAGQPPSPFEEVRDFAKAAGYTNAGEKPQPFNDYYYRFITEQGDQAKGGAKDYIVNGKMTGGFAALAYPVEYRTSGIMTFIVGADGIVYQKDLGEKTANVTAALSEFNPGDGWKPAL